MNGGHIIYEVRGQPSRGFLARPPAGDGPGVLVIQEWWGLVPHIEDVAARLAAAGFTALAPDLYHGATATHPDAAGKLFMALDIGRAGDDLRAAAEHLAAHPACTSIRVGVIGFCMGGQLALFAAQEHPDRVAAAVDFYGVHPNVRIDPARVTVPVQAHFATRDRSVPIATARALIDRFAAEGHPLDAHLYDADHAFFNDTRPEVHDPAAAALAWERTLAFLRQHVR